jgi:hypothetical protein
MRGRSATNTLVVATALPAVIVAGIATALNRVELAARLRQRVVGVSAIVFILTVPLWLIVVLRGVLYPVVVGADDLDDSWGGPTLAGAWAAHLGLGVAILLAVSFLLAWWRPPRNTYMDSAGCVVDPRARTDPTMHRDARRPRR